MKMQHLILAAGITLAAASCDTPSNMSNDYSTTNASIAVVVPATTQSEFMTRYPGATGIEWARYSDVTPIEWELTDWPAMDSEDYVVRYNMNNNQSYSWYDSDGNWVGSSNSVADFTTMPAAVNNMLSANYAGYTISSANTEYWKDRMGYEIELKNSTNKVKLLVDANGNILKQKTRTL